MIENNLKSLLALKQWTIHLASPLVTSPLATSGLPHYKSTNDKLILIIESFHSQLGVQLLHRTDDYECDSSTTPVIASCLTSLTATLIALNQNAGLNHCSREILKLLINTSQVVSRVNQTIFLIYLTLKNSPLNFFVMSNLSRPDLKQGVAMLDISNYGRRVDHHGDMCIDIDHISYEELLTFGEQIGIGSGLSEDFISGWRKQSSSSTQELVPFFSETQEAVYTNSNKKVPKTEGGNNNMMIRVAAENQQGGVAAIDHGEMTNNFGGNKSLYNDMVESFAAATGEGQDSRGSKRCSSSGDNINILVRRPSSSSSSHERGLCEVDSTFRESETREHMMMMVGGGGLRRTSSLSDASVAVSETTSFSDMLRSKNNSNNNHLIRKPPSPDLEGAAEGHVTPQNHERRKRCGAEDVMYSITRMKTSKQATTSSIALII
ncbi:hypothetical protein Lser_V15G03909 [Lactuca serriola]